MNAQEWKTLAKAMLICMVAVALLLGLSFVVAHLCEPRFTNPHDFWTSVESDFGELGGVDVSRDSIWASQMVVAHAACAIGATASMDVGKNRPFAQSGQTMATAFA